MEDKTPAVPAARPDGAESPVWITALLVFAVGIIVLGVVINTLPFGQKNFSLWIGLLGMVATLAIFSVLYSDNPIFRFFEHIFVGLATGYGIVATWIMLAEPRWYNKMMPASLVKDGEGQWLFFLALPIGLLFFTVYFPKLSWMNRFAFSVLMGWAAGNALQQFIGFLAPQITAAFRPPVTAYAPDGYAAGPNNFMLFGLHVHPWWFISLLVLTCTMAYFFFSIDHKRAGWIRVPANFGRYFIMIALGAIFGTTVMGRFSLLIERLDNLMTTATQWAHALFPHLR